MTGAAASGRSHLTTTVVGLAVAMVVVAGCGSSTASPDGGSQSFLTCASETRATPYQPGMQVVSNAGAFHVKLVESIPGPPVKGNDTWTVEVDDAAAAPLDGLTIVVTPWMPDHGHGTEPVIVTAMGAGRYELNPLYLYMGGYWEIRFSVGSAPGPTATTDDATIPICIP